MFLNCKNLNWPSGFVEENENEKTLQRRQQQWRRTSDEFHFNKFESQSPKDVFSLFRRYLPLERGMVIHFEQTWIPITQECFVRSLVEFCPVVLKMIFKFRQSIFAIFLSLPFGKCVALRLNNSESPLPKKALYQVWLKLAQWFLK